MPATTTTNTPTLNARQQDYLARTQNRWKMRFFFLKDLPTLLWWSARVEQASATSVSVSLPFNWRTQNPFKSTYFAAQGGIAELSTGLLVLLATLGEERRVSTLVTNFEAQFTKKATERVTYTCNMGPEIFAAVRKAVATDTPQEIVAESVGTTAAGLEVGRVRVTWSLKAK